MSILEAFHQFSFCREFRGDAIGCRRRNAAELAYIGILDSIVKLQELLNLFSAFCCLIFRNITHYIAHIDSCCNLSPMPTKIPRSAVPPS